MFVPSTRFAWIQCWRRMISQSRNERTRTCGSGAFLSSNAQPEWSSGQLVTKHSPVYLQKMMASGGKPILHAYDGSGTYSPKDFNFHIGAPSHEELLECSRMIQESIRSLNTLPEDFHSSMFQYGPNKGSDVVIKALSSFLSKEHKFPVHPENLMITGGASMAVSLVGMEFFSKFPELGQPVAFVEHPTYFLVHDILKDLGFRIIPIPTDAKSKIDFSAWSQVLSTIQDPVKPDKKTLRFKAMTYLIPTFHNPTGRCMSEDEARQLHEFAVKHNVLIHCDDVYNLLYYTGSPPPRMFPVGTSNHVISSGTFSKLLVPGLRVGWLEASVALIDRIENGGMLASGGCTSHYTSWLIERTIATGAMEAHVDRLRSQYTKKMNAAFEVLKSDLPAFIKWEPPKGGYFIWLTLPSGSRQYISDVLIPAAKQKKIFFQHGCKSCCHTAKECNLGCENSIRLSIGHVTVDQITDGVKQLCAILQERN